jgi:hypothetical protein
MSFKRQMAVLLVAVAIVLAVTVAPAYAAKGGVKGKPVTAEAANKDKGKTKSEDVAKSNGSGDKKGPGESNGKNRARPDQDGKGMDRGEVNDDKAWDGNNGCGNDKLDPDSPFEDDNNGKCKGLSKDTPTATPVPTTGTSKRLLEPTPTPTPDDGDESKDGDGPVDGEERDGENLRVCFHSPGNAVEVSDTSGDVQELVHEDGGRAFESTVFTEDWHGACWDASTSSVYFVLGWNPNEGHDGPLYRVETSGYASGEIHLFNPFVGTIEVGGVTATRLNGRLTNLPTID